MNGLSAELSDRVQAFLEGDLRGELAVESLAQDLADFLDGKPVDVLRELLDTLREAGGYGLSLRLLSRAWAGSPSDNLAGELAEDWIGTLLHGLSDRAAASEVALAVVPDALNRGAAFASDLGDLLLAWGLRDEAAPLVTFAAERNPGDLSAQFNLGVLLKFRGEWARCADVFRAVVTGRKDPAAQWNLGIACTALRDFASARTAWKAVGLAVPESDGDFARPGERVPVRLPTAPGAPVGAEVVWGDRLCPARVRLTGVPRYGGPAGFGDILLVDGVPVGETQLGDQTVPILEHLAVFAAAGGRLFRLRTPKGVRLMPGTTAEIATALRGSGFAAADWRGVGPASDAVGVVLPEGARPEALAAVVERICAHLPLRCPELNAELGQAADASDLSAW